MKININSLKCLDVGYINLSKYIFRWLFDVSKYSFNHKLSNLEMIVVKVLDCVKKSWISISPTNKRNKNH